MFASRGWAIAIIKLQNQHKFDKLIITKKIKLIMERLLRPWTERTVVVTMTNNFNLTYRVSRNML